MSIHSILSAIARVHKLRVSEGYRKCEWCLCKWRVCQYSVSKTHYFCPQYKIPYPLSGL